MYRREMAALRSPGVLKRLQTSDGESSTQDRGANQLSVT